MKRKTTIFFLIIVFIIGFLYIAFANDEMNCRVIHRSLKYGVISKCEDQNTECYLNNDNGSNDSRMHCLRKYDR